MPLPRLATTTPYGWATLAPVFGIAFLAFVLYACEDGDTNKAKVVFVGGYTGPQGKEVATYWRNGEEVRLGDGTNPSAVNAIFVDNNDVYAGGYEILADPVSPLLKHFTPTIWKNGARTKLVSPLSPSGMISSIFVSGGDVHAVGNVSDQNISVYWKNSEVVKSRNNISSVFIYKGDVYISGVLNGHATYWKNGVAVQLSEKLSTTISISVDNDVVYVLGNASGSSAEDPIQNTYWRNGVEVQLGTTVNETSVRKIVATNGDVYICGSQVIDVNGKKAGVACYWKNGTRVDLTDGAVWSFATGISVMDNEVFVCVSEDPIPNTNTPTSWYYSGETAVQLTDLNLRSRVYSIFVVK